MGKLSFKKGKLLVFILTFWFLISMHITAESAVVLRAGASDPEGTTSPALSIGKLCELATKLSKGELNVPTVLSIPGSRTAACRGRKSWHN